MSAFTRFLLFWSDYELQRINTRMLRLLDSYVAGEIDVAEYLRRRNAMDVEKRAAMADIARHKAALDGYAINQEVQA